MRAPLARLDAVLVQALIAAALSFAHIHDIAMAAGQDGWKAWAYPVSVDLLLVAAWRRLRSGTAKAAAWCWFVIALTASLGANIATAGLLDLAAVPAWLRILVAGWPAVAFLGGTLLAHSKPKTASVAEVIEDQEDAPESTPDPPAPDLPVIEASPEPPPVPVPAALINHARKVAAEHHTRTGAPIDTPTLRARLGVPAPMAEAIAAHL
ncbi:MULTISPECIES: DUF2637 domain-containing protein [Streptomyces]|uniref:DUF2637 domain-containing protein n=1 Tax=Streptomyces rochei TaxID=1928 RepID=A0AAX3ZUZ2_STRRO|nr:MULTISPECIES: DUF2637 domain-containing protein [Streptomyces]RSS14213.1 DUF2637 domain-containing protein [Streptomyces sp. WAC05458]RSS90814.1 DUF2637 domain-containing protein [Streptomyces sp. WAC02707]WMC90904.1 DUF2637 domain-containing protein [Streptomyces rochei]